MLGTMKSMVESSLFDGGNAAYLEDLYERYLQGEEIDPQWGKYFKELTNNQSEVSHAQIKLEFEKLAKSPRTSVIQVGSDHEIKQMQVLRLINAYRLQGHLHAKIDPLDMREMLDENAHELELQEYKLSSNDLNTPFNIETFVGPHPMTLGELYSALNETYCGPIGIEYMHIPSNVERQWLQERIERSRARPNFDAEFKKQILNRLNAAEGLERYIGAKFPGAKRFSLEGGESLIPLLDEIIQRSGNQGVREAVIGMAHRGRLNVLVNILGKQPKELFEEFEGKKVNEAYSGDVKYHQGFSSDVSTSGGNLHLALAFNPSHLEIVTPVVAGSVRARQERAKDLDRNKVLAIAIHGDAAVAGQGVVMEILNMSQTRGYTTGGTVHIVINNQVGFTTSDPHDARSTLYCTDVAKVVLAPIFHVNADNPEAVVLVAQIALDYRARFNKDVIIDLVCYRRHGHNEADDPLATQPIMYQKIKSHPSVCKLYAKQLMDEKIIDENTQQQMMDENNNLLDKGECIALNITNDSTHNRDFSWEPYFSEDWREEVKTAISPEKLKELSQRILTLPDNFSMHSRVAKVYEERVKMAQGETPADWGFAENLAYAALLDDNWAIRISGQDCGRGTFFHRHAVLHEQKTGDRYIPLNHVKENQPQFTIIDSILSEEAVLAFEYGYASTDPKTLVIWEAQFGDFVNGAQVVIDQFISSGEQKWGRLCGLTMLLPHGYEGQGPEHSSARLERFLQLCAQHNIQVCVPSNASQIFHLLRRQMLRKLRRPLIIMSPKSLLRLKGASCHLDDLTQGRFEPIIGEVNSIDAAKVTRVVLCSGKVYYDLAAKRDETLKNHIAILRIEQLYPFPEIELKAQLSLYPNAQEIIWTQEEPRNQGAWFSSQHHMRACLTEHQDLRYAGREASASPAVGSPYVHAAQQASLVNQALN